GAALFFMRRSVRERRRQEKDMSKMSAVSGGRRLFFWCRGFMFPGARSRLFPMRFRYLPFLLAIVTLSACATFDQSQLTQIRSQGVPPEIVSRLSHNRPLPPPEGILVSRPR